MPLAGLNRITDIALFVSDLPRAIAFYRDLMELELKRLDTGFAEFWMEGAILALWEEADVRRALDFAGAARRGPHAMIAIRLDLAAAVDAAYAGLAARGVVFRSPPKTYPWHAHAAYFSDPDDNLWEIYCWVGPPARISLSPARGRGEVRGLQDVRLSHPASPPSRGHERVFAQEGRRRNVGGTRLAAFVPRGSRSPVQKRSIRAQPREDHHPRRSVGRRGSPQLRRRPTCWSAAASSPRSASPAWRRRPMPRCRCQSGLLLHAGLINGHTHGSGNLAKATHDRWSLELLELNGAPGWAGKQTPAQQGAQHPPSVRSRCCKRAAPPATT